MIGDVSNTLRRNMGNTAINHYGKRQSNILNVEIGNNQHYLLRNCFLIIHTIIVLVCQTLRIQYINTFNTQAFNMYMYYGTPLYNKIKLQRDKQKYKLLILCFKRWIDICKNGESYDNDSLYFTVARSNYINFLKSFSNKKVKIARNVLKLCVKHPMFSLHYHIENIFWCILVGKLNHALNIIRHILDWFER
eukprot:439494_1